MQIYHYDDNGFFTAETEATNKDPLESILQGHDVWVIPGFATTLPPPEDVPEGKRAYFDFEEDQVWKLKDWIIVPPNPDIEQPDNPIPPKPPIPVISKRQFWQQIAMLGWIGFQDAIDFMQTGKLPLPFEQAVLSLNQTDPSGVTQFKARMAFMANEYDRNNEFVALLGGLLEKTDDQIDGLFIGASQAL